MIVMVLGSVIIGILICGNFETKNIHDEIACGNGRLAIILTKTVSISLFLLLLLLPYVLMSTIGFASGIGFGQYAGVPSAFFNILSNVQGVEVTSSYVLKSVVLSVLITLTYLAKISICIPVAFKARKSIVVIMTGFVTTFAFDILSTLTKGIDGFNFLKFFPYSIVYKLTLDCSVKVMVQSAISSILFISFMLVITNLVFRKAEIK
jgi:ABC-2 type transport system permease protein